MAKRKANVLEVILIGCFVAVVLFFGWQTIGKIQKKLSGMSSTETTGTLAGITSPSIATLLEQLRNKLDKLKNPTTDWQGRIETAGIIGKLIAELNKAEDSALRAKLEALLKEFASKTGETLSDEQANKCLSSPSSCTTLMTVSGFTWSTSVDMNDTYNGDKIPVKLVYTYSYINDAGETVTTSMVQDVEVQKEQNTGNNGKTYSSFLKNYMDSKFNENLFTGDATNVQQQVNKYMDSKNCELSKKGEDSYVCFTSLSTCSQTQATNLTGLVVKDYVDNN